MEGADVQPHDVEPEQPHAADDLEDTEEKRVSRDPGAPSRSEREEHNIDHTPYRSWCEDCVRGRGLGEQHKSSGSDERGQPWDFDVAEQRGRAWKRVLEEKPMLLI